MTFALLTLAGCQTVQAPAPVTSGGPAPKPLAYDRTVTLDIHAVKGWQRTGILVRPGDRLKLTATGRWSMGPFCGYTEADGAGIAPLCKQDPLNLGVPYSTLIGRIGHDGALFPVGKSLILTPTTEGELFLNAYSGIVEDNVGAVSVGISHDDPAAGTEPVPTHRDPV